MAHLLMSPGGTVRESAVLRWSLVLAYVLFTLAGVGLFVSKVLHDNYGDSSMWMAGFIAAGATFSALGAATVRWPGEFMGLPLLGSGFAGLGVELYIQGHPGASGSLLMFLGLAVICVARWQVVLSVYRIARVGSRVGE